MIDADYIRYYAQYQAAQGCSAATIREREILVRALLARTERTLDTITRHDLIGDLGRPLAAKTKQNYKSFFHTFFTWMQDEGFRADNPGARLPRVRVPKQDPNPLRTADIEQLLHSGIYGKTRLYVLLYAYQGFRCVEIAAVAGETVDWRRKRILSKDGKGGREVWRPIHPLVWDEIQKYPRAGVFFPSPTNAGHVGRKNVSNVLSKALKRAGIVGHRPHQLRVWQGTALLEGGVPTTTAAALLRHSDLQSIAAYQLVSERLLEEAQNVLPLVKVPTSSGRRRAA
ncbi:tyrosine-type recombinase/integrase [Microterricola viridarii]|uniref:Site-specific recombinase XerD n=1 Tax=Microterricola viridarii TaxID=412690 RepID=A0A0Y0MYT3_9MICO|nr:tyrosine-type recombinase/integrase [Microterricola viridarii]AMB58229.1 hypothetical protein AWU67_04495 [Microterricola viridarii]